MNRRRIKIIVLEVRLKAYNEIDRDMLADGGRIRGVYMIIVVQML